MMAKPRNYKREYRRYHSTRAYQVRRNARKRARRLMGLKPGDKRHVDHKRPLRKGGSNSRRNLRVVSARTNQRKGWR
jgi:5-methylcytosine-specific restriction endonuclease McrA